MPDKPKIPVLSFFTGAGFLDMGFELAGFEIAWTNEINPGFVDLYENGYTSWREANNIKRPAKIAEKKSIDSLTTDAIKSKAFPNGMPSAWGIIGGPPCADFSISGKNIGSEGTYGRLTETLIDLITALAPSFFVMENVSGLYRIKKHREYLNRMRVKLYENNYLSDLAILNSIHFNVPQDRPRMILVGINCRLKKKLGRKNLFLYDNWFPFPEGTHLNYHSFPWPKKTPFQDNCLKPDGIPDELTVNSILATDPPPDKLPNGLEYFEPHSDKFKLIDEGDTTGKSFKRLHRYRYSPTACYGNNEVHLHPGLPRRLSVREVMRIQGVPDEYVLPATGTLTQKFKFIGNGVPVPLAYNVALTLKKFLYNLGL